MRNIRRNEKRFALAHNMIDNVIAFADSHFDVAFELIEILLRIDEMKIVPRIRPLDNHNEKIAPVVQVTIAHRRLEFFPVLLDPVFEINRRSHSGHLSERISCRGERQNQSLDLSSQETLASTGDVSIISRMKTADLALRIDIYR